MSPLLSFSLFFLSTIIVPSICLPDGFGFDLSVGLQSSPLSAATISDITSGSVFSGVKYYKFYGFSFDHDIAAAIVSKASNPGNIKLYIEIIPSKVNNLQNSDIASLVTEWDDLKSYIYCIALGTYCLNILKFKIDLLSDLSDLTDFQMVCIYSFYCLGNEPVLNNIDFSVLPSKLQMVYDYLPTQSGWENVKVSIPFSQNIFASTYVML